MGDSRRCAELVARADDRGSAAERSLHLVERSDDLNSPGRADVRERDVGELARRIREDADAHAGSMEPAENGAGVAVRPEVHGTAVGREPLEQGPPVAELHVESSGGVDAVGRQIEVDMGAPRGVVEPVLPEPARVGEDGVELDGERLHRLDARLAPSNRRAVRELR